MIAYLDTSAVVKLYVEEAGAPTVRRVVQDATQVGTSRVTYAEARAAFARRARERGFAPAAYKALLRSFEQEWETYVRLDVTEPLVKLAGDLAERHALRAYDAIQLASALTLQRDLPATPVGFVAADGHLLDAAAHEQLAVTRVAA
jgi:predicted nucleic acid-binding protein